MKLSTAELADVRSHGFYITEKCDGCGKLLNQTVCYMIAGRPEVFCSAECRDVVFFGDLKLAKKHAASRICSFCGASLHDRNRGALYCSDRCRKRYARKQNAGTSKNPDSALTESTISEPPKARSMRPYEKFDSDAAIGANAFPARKRAMGEPKLAPCTSDEVPRKMARTGQSLGRERC